jgi:hypothetical protein
VSGSGALVPGEGSVRQVCGEKFNFALKSKIERPPNPVLGHSEDNLHPAGRLVTSSWLLVYGRSL